MKDWKPKILPEPKGKKPVIDLKIHKRVKLTTRPTHKIYKCIDLTERFCGGWADCFKLNHNYCEGTDSLAKSMLKDIPEKDNILYLIPNNNEQTYGMFVDKENFKLLEDEK